jgi:hypothetical protein
MAKEYCWVISKAADHIPLCWSLDLSWTTVYTHVLGHMYVV